MSFTKDGQPKWKSIRPILCKMDGCSETFHTTSPSKKYCVECSKIPAWRRKKINDRAKSVSILQPPLNETEDIVSALLNGRGLDKPDKEKHEWIQMLVDNFMRGYERDLLLLKEVEKLKLELKKLRNEKG